MNRNNNKPRKRRGLINPDKTKTYKVYQECTLLDFVKMKLPQQSEKNCKRIIMNHQVGVNGAPVSIFKAPLYKEDEVTLAWKPIRRYKRDNLPIIYEDDELIVIDKPSGLLSVASDKEKRRTAYRMVADYLSYKDPNSRCFIVHRLDEDTSGVLLFAKNNIIRTALQHQWNDIVKTREYIAIVEPGDIEKEGTLVNYLKEDRTQKIYVTKDKVHGKLAKMDFKKLKSNKNYAMLKVNLYTGRKNQIRVQLGYYGYFVLGDDKYGKPSNPLKRLALHASTLALIHPFKKMLMTFTAPVPECFNKLF